MCGGNRIRRGVDIIRQNNSEVWVCSITMTGIRHIDRRIPDVGSRMLGEL